MAYLTVEYPDGKEARIMLLKPAVIIGRAPDSDICIDAEWVSGKHAVLSRDGDGYRIEDLGSSNGTYINYERIESEGLNDNDLIFLGRTKILYRHGSSVLEESSVELDILGDDQSGIFTQVPPPHPAASQAQVLPPSKSEVAELLRTYETSDRLPIDAFRKVPEKEPTVRDVQKTLREANLKVATLEVELEAQRKRAEQEIDRLMKELTVWKSRYFERVEESRRMKRGDFSALGPRKEESGRVKPNRLESNQEQGEGKQKVEKNEGVE